MCLFVRGAEERRARARAREESERSKIKKKKKKGKRGEEEPLSRLSLFPTCALHSDKWRERRNSEELRDTGKKGGGIKRQQTERRHVPGGSLFLFLASQRQRGRVEKRMRSFSAFAAAAEISR